MTGSNIFIRFFFYVFGLISSFGKNSFLIGSYLVVGLLAVPFITGVFGPLESEELGLVLSSLLSKDFLSLIVINLLFKLPLFANKLFKLIR